MSLFRKYTKGDIVELRPITEFDIRFFWDNGGVVTDGYNNVVHISKEQRLKGSPKIGDFIVRDVHNNSFAWLIDQETFKEKFKEVIED